MATTRISFFISVLFVVLACSNVGSGRSTIALKKLACASTVEDSKQTPSGWNRIHSESNGIYGELKLTRQSESGMALSMDYMVHEPAGEPIALIVLIAGGQLNAGIEGNIGEAPAKAGGNFLVRSAHLFAAQGFRVITIDRPSDFSNFTSGGSAGWEYDKYRISMAHAVDLSQLINTVNNTNLPVILAGTSRGTISAVAQHNLASVLFLSAALTSGGNGIPIGSNEVVNPANIKVPVRVIWHEKDACLVTTPAGAHYLVGQIPKAVGVSVSGGFASSSSSRDCNADHFHGFPGIESCVVKDSTDWIKLQVKALKVTSPVALPLSTATTVGKPISIDLAAASPGVAETMKFSIPHETTSLRGTIRLRGNVVTYTPPAETGSVDDTFVYVVESSDGGKSHNIVVVTINS